MGFLTYNSFIMRRATEASMFWFEVGRHNSISEIFLPIYINSERGKSHYEKADNKKQRKKEIISCKTLGHLVTISSWSPQYVGLLIEYNLL